MIQTALFLLATLQGTDTTLVSQWAFDGDVNDSGPAKLPTKAVGRFEFIDSPISGKMAVFNGVDAYLQVDPPQKLTAGGDFTLSAWVFPLEKGNWTLFARQGWSLTISDKGGTFFKTKAGSTGTLGNCPVGQWSFVALVVKRGADRQWPRVYVNAGPLANDLVDSAGEPLQDLDPAQAPLLIGKGLQEGKPFCGLLDDVRLRTRALDYLELEKEMDAAMPWLRRKPHAKAPFRGKFELEPNDVIAFVGGENTRVGLDQGYLETLVSMRTVGKTVRFRNMAWEGDTVYEQPRPVNFGSWTDQFRRTGTSVIFAQFGQIEALEGKAGLARFVEAYESLLNQFSDSTKRIVLVSPTPFGKGAAHQPDLTPRNEDLKLYVDAIRALAAKRGCLFVDLSTKALADDRLTRDGLHLTTAGQWIAARETVRQLELAGVSDLDEPNPQGAFPRESYEKLRGAIRTKNALWNDSWRPANWAFLSGDRMEQPSSRDHVDRRIRWFPVEVQQLPAMVRREEEKIEALLQASEKK